MPTKSDAPGLKWRARKNGQRVAYWVARADLVKRGYKPSSVRLFCDENNPQDVAAMRSRCERLHNEMLIWENQGERRDPKVFDGSLAMLVRLYETGEGSPYRTSLKQITAQSYSKHMRLLLRRVGEVYISQLTAADVLRWFHEISAPLRRGGRPRLGYANLTVSILKSVLSYGAILGFKDCKELREQLALARFQHAPARTEFPIYEQIIAFRAAAHKLGRPSAALWVTLQFELGLRRRDVIGEWVDDQEGPTDGIRAGRRFWRDGLTWAHIGADGVLRKTVSKTERSTARKAVHRIANHPDLMAELAHIPPERRVGPMVINETTGLPYETYQCRRYFRLIAREAGLPDTLWNMDVRAGAVTEAYEGGATTEGAMALAAHTQASTSHLYKRNTLEQTSRVAELRIASRKRKLGTS